MKKPWSSDWIWVRYTQAGRVGLGRGDMMFLRVSGLVDCRDINFPEVDWELLLPTNVEDMAELMEAVSAKAKLLARAQDRGGG